MPVRKRTQRETVAEMNRRRYPELAKIMDEVKALWPGAKVVAIRPGPAAPTSDE